MKKETELTNTTIAGILALGANMAARTAQAVIDQPKNWEKCSDIVKAGVNDCGALGGKHGCAGQAAIDNMATEWIYFPEGTCTKITDGSVATVKPAKKCRGPDLGPADF